LSEGKPEKKTGQESEGGGEEEIAGGGGAWGSEGRMVNQG